MDYEKPNVTRFSALYGEKEDDFNEKRVQNVIFLWNPFLIKCCELWPFKSLIAYRRNKVFASNAEKKEEREEPSSPLLLKRSDTF